MTRLIGAVVLGGVLLLTAAPVRLSAQTSPPVTITVTPPTPLAPIRIIAPVDGVATYKVGDLMVIKAVAPAGTGVLEFFSNGTRLGEASGPDYQLQVRIGTTGVKALTVRPKPPPLPPPPPPPPPITDGKLLQASDLVYLGAFKGPAWNGLEPCDAIDYGGYGLAYYQAHNSLFVVGHGWKNCVSEITIPAVLSVDPATMVRATFLQRPVDITEGKRFGDVLAGLLVFHGRLIADSRVSYDANHSQNALRKSHYVSGLDLSQQGDALGPLEITSAATNFLTGYMASVPQAWQAALGGPALTGWCCGPSIVGRTSQGPAVYAFDPDQLGVVDPVPGSALVYYPLDHPTLGDWRTPAPWPPVAGQGENHVYNGTAEINGVAFPDGSRSVLFFGFIGQGTFCYGDTTCDPAQVYTLFGDPAAGLRVCALRTARCPGPNEGHSYYSVDGSGGFAPTAFQVWAYDAGDLAKVAKHQQRGTHLDDKGKTVIDYWEPWDVRPYAYWTYAVPGMDFSEGAKTRGVAYDAVHQRLYLYQGQASGQPIFRVFQLKL